MKYQIREGFNPLDHPDENDHLEIKETFWTKPNKQAIFFTSNLLLLSPLIYFEVTNPAFRADTLQLMENYPLHSLLILTLSIIQLRAIYKKWVLTNNVIIRQSDHSYNSNVGIEEETPEEDLNNSIWAKHKIKIIAVGIIAVAVLGYFEFTNPEVANKTIALTRENPVILIGIALIVIVAIGYNYRQDKIAEKINKQEDNPDVQLPPKNEDQQAKPNKFISLAKEQVPLIAVVGLLFAGNYAYQHWDATFETFSKPWVAGISIGITALVLVTTAIVIAKEIQANCNNKNTPEEEYQRFYKNEFD